SAGDIMILKGDSSSIPLSQSDKAAEPEIAPSALGPASDILVVEPNRDDTFTETGKTDPTGQCFISYDRERLAEIAQLVAALHDHGVPTWQDINNLDYFHIEQRLLDVLNDPRTASALFWISPEIQYSKMIAEVEAPNLIKRAKDQDGFALLPILA